ncbi:MAG TPA: ADOP family duplicated permease [Vicinamibacterales bacterium]|nr:ADOP family duplicated permease [Vicinamibacterales bacterium]
MRPDERELDDEIRGHIALSVKERIEAGEDPVAARRAALAELGYLPAVHESMRRVWYGRWFDAAAALGREMRIGLRSLLRARGMAATVVVTLALGIGANAAIFSVVRGVLLRPLVNRGEDRLIYIRQSASGTGTENLTFSVQEINDIKARATTIGAFGDFSTVELTMTGDGEPHLLKAGVVGGSYFDVMGLRPVLGRLLNAGDDGQDAAGAVVLTHRYWTTSFNSDPSVIGRQIRLAGRAATIVGVLEPSVPYPADTEIIGNMVVSPHHLGATMNVERAHRMTELFGRLAPGASVEDARAELIAAHATMVKDHPEAYSTRADFRLSVTPLRDQITAPARTILLVLLAAAAVVFVIACSNVANLILARSVRREGELAIRAALGASRGALRRTLLAESLVLCGLGAILGVLLARPFVALVAAYAARFSVRALDVRVDATVLWVGAALAIAAAILLAFVPRLPLSDASGATAGSGLTGGNLRITPGTNRRLRLFATTQIAFSFVLLTGAGMLIAALIALQTTNAGFLTRQILAFDIPPFSLSSPASRPAQGAPEPPDLYGEAMANVGRLPGVDGVVGGIVVPWRDSGFWRPIQFAVEGYTPADGEENPYARSRSVGPGFFATLGIPVVAGREFTEADRIGSERLVMVSQSIAQRLFPNGLAVNRTLSVTSSLSTQGGVNSTPSRIVGVVADVDDENVDARTTMTIYQVYRTKGLPMRLFVRTAGDPQALVQPVTRVLRELSANQAVARPATLEDIRAEVLAPERLNAFVVSGFAGIALLIAVVGVSGVLAFSVSARMREFGVRLAIGSAPRQLLLRVLSEGASIVAIGIAAGVAAGYILAAAASSYFAAVELPGALPLIAAASVLGITAVAASLLPAARASRVDVLQALKAE